MDTRDIEKAIHLPVALFHSDRIDLDTFVNLGFKNAETVTSWRESSG